MFGMGFSEILIIAVIAILFLGPDKLPSAMVDIAKFFRNVKKTIGTVKNSIEEEMHVSDIKEEALAYKKELLGASEKLTKVTDVSNIGDTISSYADDLVNDDSEKEAPKSAPKQEKVTFKKKDKIIDKEEDADV
jgi:sec-independent protein translocase protein TatB